MTKLNIKHSSEKTNKDDSVSRRVVEELRERVDQAAEKGEKFERKLHESGVEAQDRHRKLNNSIKSIARDNLWAVENDSVTLGIVIGGFGKPVLSMAQQIHADAQLSQQ